MALLFESAIKDRDKEVPVVVFEHRSRFSVVVAAACGMCAAAVQAADGDAGAVPDRRLALEITPFLGYADGGEFEDPVDGSERNVGGDRTWGVILNLPADHASDYELLFSRQDTELGGAAPFDVDVQYLQVGGTISYADARYVFPYFGLAAGVTRFSPGESGLDDETDFSLSAGAGVRVPISRHFAVRLDARAFVTLTDSNGLFFCRTPRMGGIACGVRARSDTFTQYAAALGVSYRF